SPSAKGSLSNYLVSSQNEASNLSTVPTARGPSDNQDQVRRNLTSAIESSDSVHGVENPELQQFATNFLSYYCSDLPTTQVNAHKRPGSPSVTDLEDKSIKKRHISSVGNQTHAEEHQMSLRKCNRPSTEVADMALCDTPRLAAVKVIGEETPQSMRGSSIFSPGDSFWKEAIQIADGMSKANGVFLEGAKRDADLAFSGLNGNSMDKEVSPLPVKHFDFSCEDKRMVVDAPSMSTPCNQVQSLCKLQDTNSSCVITKKRSDELSPPNDNIKSISPNTDIKSYNVTGLNSVENTPSSSVPLNDRLDISNWLPSEICNTYKRRGISKLYPWQVDCLQVDGVLQKRNLVYCASTSAGKSFVAEILMLRRVLTTRKVALLVLPYVSICAEKAEHLEALLEPLDKHVRSYYGSQGGGTLPKDTAVAVCTIEKANSLLNRLLEEGRLSEVGIIVIDELHMVGDQHRGYLLELMLTKLRYGAGEGRVEFSSGESSGSSSGKMDPTHGLQIVGMSATLPNVGAVADWLQAALYQTDFRPVPLEEYIKVGNSIYNKKMELVRMIPKRADLGGKDPDNIIELCNEVVQEGHSVLIFCSSRKGCESTAKHVAKYLKSFTVNVNGENEYPDIASAIDALKKSPAGLDPVLAETLPSGVAYHHAGL
ncbi:hypothetical protein M8C21_005020, partial [Ambrosia artemisiifolia]